MSATEQYEVVIGLEVHAQLKTRTKLFCGDTTAFGKEPNQRVVDHLLLNSRVGIEADRIIWENISLLQTPESADCIALRFGERTCRSSRFLSK